MPALRGSQGKLNQVIVNLLVNASHAMSSFGGELTIRSLCRRHPETQKPDCGVLTIEDTGAGIESEDLDKIFAPFYTTKEPGDGTGLGLYISFSIIESLGGTIRVSSEVNVGTRFEIHLPLDAETEML